MDSIPRLWLRCYSSFIFYLSNIKLLLATINSLHTGSLGADWRILDDNSLMVGRERRGCYKVGYYLDSNKEHGFRREPAFSLAQTDDPPSRQYLAGLSLLQHRSAVKTRRTALSHPHRLVLQQLLHRREVLPASLFRVHRGTSHAPQEERILRSFSEISERGS